MERLHKSHTRSELLAAVSGGEQLWYLDTGNSGDDDTLIGNEEDVWRDLEEYHSRSREEMEARGWSLTRVGG